MHRSFPSSREPKAQLALAQGSSARRPQPRRSATQVMLDNRIPRGDNFTDEEPEENVKWWRKATDLRCRSKDANSRLQRCRQQILSSHALPCVCSGSAAHAGLRASLPDPQASHRSGVNVARNISHIKPLHALCCGWPKKILLLLLLLRGPGLSEVRLQWHRRHCGYDRGWCQRCPGSEASRGEVIPG